MVTCYVPTISDFAASALWDAFCYFYRVCETSTKVAITAGNLFMLSRLRRAWKQRKKLKAAIGVNSVCKKVFA